MEESYSSDSGSTSGGRETSGDSDHVEAKVKVPDLELKLKDLQKVLVLC